MISINKKFGWIFLDDELPPAGREVQFLYGSYQQPQYGYGYKLNDDPESRLWIHKSTINQEADLHEVYNVICWQDRTPFPIFEKEIEEE